MRIKNINRIFFTLFFLCLFHNSHAQIAIGGIINRYYQVTSFTQASGGLCASPAINASVTIGAAFGAPVPASLAPGMEVLIIQMQAGVSGVVNRTTATSAYGDVSNGGGAGNYEYATIATVAGSTVTFTTQLINSYDPTGKVQLIPTWLGNTASTSYTTSANIVPLPYSEVNGVGGVITLSTTGNLTLNNQVNADAMGFQGGDTIGNVYAPWPFMYIQTACCASFVTGGGVAMDAINALLYAFPFIPSDARSGAVCGTVADRIVKGARKGKGIFGVIAGEELSWGKIANGGGGAHGYNSGGGGAGGYNGGGNGGYEHEWACNSGVTRPAGLDHGGRGGLGIQGGTTALFMGGGAGAGHGDGSSQTIAALTTGGYATGDFRGPTCGGDGGGIIIIKAAQIISSGAFIISAKGGFGGYANQDGAGGGGGGGSIVLQVPSYSGIITLDASGGAGGHVINPNSADCHGTGGGGGGGRVVLSLGAAPAGVTINISAGAPGRLLQVGGSGATAYLFDKTTFCGADIFWGAVTGIAGDVTYGTPINTQTCGSLPVTIFSIYANLLSDETVGIYWKTATEQNSSHFTVERSTDGINFENIGIVQAQGNSRQLTGYSFLDTEVSAFSDAVYYRLRITDVDGSYEYSSLVVVNLKGTLISVYPNPVLITGSIKITYYSNRIKEKLNAEVTDVLGRGCLSQILNVQKGNNVIELSVAGLAPGIYMLILNDGYGKTIKKIIID